MWKTPSQNTLTHQDLVSSTSKTPSPMPDGAAPTVVRLSPDEGEPKAASGNSTPVATRMSKDGTQKPVIMMKRSGLSIIPPPLVPKTTHSSGPSTPSISNSRGESPDSPRVVSDLLPPADTQTPSGNYSEPSPASSQSHGSGSKPKKYATAEERRKAMSLALKGKPPPTCLWI
jgi:hypothetical protein